MGSNNLHHCLSQVKCLLLNLNMRNVNKLPKDIDLKYIFRNFLLKKKKINNLVFYIFYKNCIKIFLKLFINNGLKNIGYDDLLNIFNGFVSFSFAGVSLIVLNFHRKELISLFLHKETKRFFFFFFKEKINKIFPNSKT